MGESSARRITYHPGGSGQNRPARPLSDTN